MSEVEVNVTMFADISQALDGIRKARLAVRRMSSKFGIRRQCDLFTGYHGPHNWERLNPATDRPYRRWPRLVLLQGISMSGLWFDLALVVAIAPLAAWLLLRDLKRAVARRAARRRLEAKLAAMRVEIERFQSTIRDAFMPAMQAAAKSMATFAKQVNASLERAGQQMADEAEKYANGERP